MDWIRICVSQDKNKYNYHKLSQCCDTRFRSLHCQQCNLHAARGFLALHHSPNMLRVDSVKCAKHQKNQQCKTWEVSTRIPDQTFQFTPALKLRNSVSFFLSFIPGTAGAPGSVLEAPQRSSCIRAFLMRVLLVPVGPNQAALIMRSSRESVCDGLSAD